MRNHMNITFLYVKGPKYVKLNEHYCFWRCTASLDQLKDEKRMENQCCLGFKASLNQLKCEKQKENQCF